LITTDFFSGKLSSTVPTTTKEFLKGFVLNIMGKKLYNVNGAKFEVDERYSIVKPIGYGAYGFVWYELSLSGSISC